MKKLLNILISFSILFTFAYAAEVPDTISVHDNAGILSSSTEKYILTQNEALSKSCGAKIIFLTDDTTDELSTNEYANFIFKEWNIEKIGRSNSVLVFMCPEKNDYIVLVSDGISAALTKVFANECLVKYMEPDFAKKNYDEAAVKTYNAFAGWYNDNYNKVELSLTEDLSEYEAIVDYEEKVSRRKTISITIIIVLIAVAALSTSIYVRRKMRMKRLQKRRIERRRRYMRARQKTR